MSDWKKEAFDLFLKGMGTDEMIYYFDQDITITTASGTRYHFIREDFEAAIRERLQDVAKKAGFWDRLVTLWKTAPEKDDIRIVYDQADALIEEYVGPIIGKGVCEVCNGSGGVEAFQNGRTTSHPCPRGCNKDGLAKDSTPA